MSFRDDAQTAAACAALCALVGLPSIWTINGPGPTAFAVRDGKDGLSSAERLVVRVAWQLWSREGALELHELLELDPGRLTIVCALLVAVSEGSERVDHWLMVHRPRPRPLT